jgi:hypothetical protein
VTGAERPAAPTPQVPPWRIAAAAIVLAALCLMGAILVPVYLHNVELERFLRQAQPSSEEALQQTIIDKGHALGLDIVPDHLQIRRPPGTSHMDVHYVVRVSLWLYTVDLHFSSNTASASK